MSGPQPARSAPNGEDLSAQDRRTLLQVARRALEAHFGGRPLSLPEGGPALRRPRGAFVTLRRREDDELRGCVGIMEAEQALVTAVARMAVAAATADARFTPVTGDELPRLSIEISALGPLVPVRPDEVEVGRHGLLIGLGGRRGVLLPQVPVEQGWDRETFLEKTCRKAGLPPGSWRRPEASLRAFTAAVFAEEDEPAR